VANRYSIVANRNFLKTRRAYIIQLFNKLNV